MPVYRLTRMDRVTEREEVIIRIRAEDYDEAIRIGGSTMETFAEFRAWLDGYASASHSLTAEELYSVALAKAKDTDVLRIQNFARAMLQIDQAVSAVMENRR